LQKQLFEFPLEIKIVFYSGGKILYKRMNISKQSESIVVAVKEKPTKLIMGPDVSLLFEESRRN
jgi:hypothetical protein